MADGDAPLLPAAAEIVLLGELLQREEMCTVRVYGRMVEYDALSEMAVLVDEDSRIHVDTRGIDMAKVPGEYESQWVRVVGEYFSSGSLDSNAFLRARTLWQLERFDPAEMKSALTRRRAFLQRLHR